MAGGGYSVLLLIRTWLLWMHFPDPLDQSERLGWGRGRVCVCVSALMSTTIADQRACETQQELSVDASTC